MTDHLLKACPDAIFTPLSAGRWLASNPRVRGHVELDAAAMRAVSQLPDSSGAMLAALQMAQGYDRTRFAFAEGKSLWGDPSGLGERQGEATQGERLMQLLQRRWIVCEPDGTDYRDFLAAKTNPLDRKHLGNFHDRVGEYLTLELRLRDKWTWWHDQKFQPDGTAMQPGPYRAVQDHFMRSVVQSRNLRGMRILDFGCGNGHYARLFADQGAKVVGVDTAEALIDLARHNHGNLAEFRFAPGDAAVVDLLSKYKNCEFDIIFLSDVLLLMLGAKAEGLTEAIGALLDQFRRLLRPGRGELQMMEPNATFFLAGRYGGKDLPYAIIPEYREPVFNVVPTLDRVVALMAERGFGLVGYQHPQLDPDEGDADFAGWAHAFPLWDFMTFTPVAEFLSPSGAVNRD
ncbi:methyltransferase domain-containing protein [Ferrovibrio terrae]|uniref:class I SAM-dependent methyltransferase n=2 Tax=Ferrovibrio terrae TaxID=2594003 RepID=UPI0031380947